MSEDLPLLVFAGVATEDAIAVVDRYPGADERVTSESISFAGGGPAATAAVAAARLGMRTAVIAAVGDDEAGELVRSRLHAEGVDVSRIRTVPGAATSRSVVVISGEQQARSIVNQSGPVLELEESDDELLRAAAWVHVDQHGWRPVRDRLRRVQDDTLRSLDLSVDAGNPIDGLELDGIALYAPTLQSLRARGADAGASDEELMRRSLQEGARSVVVTDGGRGSSGIGPDGALVQVAAPALEITSTLGAGDVFHGALLAGLVHADRGDIAPGLAGAIAYATTAATLSCRGVDGRSGIPRHADVTRHLSPTAQR